FTSWSVAPRWTVQNAGAVEEFRGRQSHDRPFILLYAGMTDLSAGRIDEAARPESSDPGSALH
ncbi:MAG: hypothetical protein DMD95_10045, partial [Candidatus Rokuibacteriota bacterium]